MMAYHQTLAPFKSSYSIPSERVLPNPESPLTKPACHPSCKDAASSKTLASEHEITVDSYDNYLEVLEEEFCSERSVITDRFIPTRRQLKTDLIVKEYENKQSNENTAAAPVDPCSLSLSDIYKKCIMN
jgi:hypothetical protein